MLLPMLKTQMSSTFLIVKGTLYSKTKRKLVHLSTFIHLMLSLCNFSLHNEKGD